MKGAERTRLIESGKEAVQLPSGEQRTVRVWSKDHWVDHPVWRAPVEALLLNVDNRRFKAERRLLEGQLGHSLDPENSEDDEQSVISLLLDKNHRVDGNRIIGVADKDFDALRRDWAKRKQETPFWIRPDGTVRNGNRRLAMLKRLQAEEGSEGYEWAEVIILDANAIDELEMFKMEQREQLTENLKVKYTDMNLLLTLRDAAETEEIDWADDESIERVAGELQHIVGQDKAYAAIQLRAIKYMDAFLDDDNAAGDYYKLLRNVERFRDVGKLMQQVEVEYPDDATDMLALAFSFVRAGRPHREIRELRNLFLEARQRYEELRSKVEQAEESWREQNEPELGDPDTASLDETEDGEEPAPVVVNYPKDAVAAMISDSLDPFNARRRFNLASQIIQAAERLGNLNEEAILQELSGERGEEVRQALSNIVEWSERAKSLLSDSQ